jgi:hypothetical protein
MRSVHAAPADVNPDPIGPGRTDVTFTQTAPYSKPVEIERRFGFHQTAPEYDITREKFQVLVPDTYSPDAAWGLFVWVTPNDDPSLRKDMDAELAKHRLLFVGAYSTGNGRNPIDRCRLALDATCNMTRRFKIDYKRIYVGGFSGGSRIASLLGVACGDIFTGTLCVCGVNFYKIVAASGGQHYPPTYIPEPSIALRAKRNGRFVLLTGEHDMNRESTKSNWERGFKAEGFQNVLFLDIKDMKHELPTAAVFNTSLNFLDGIPSLPVTPTNVSSASTNH